MALRGAERHLGEPVHALAPRSSRRARFRRGRSEAASSVAEDQRALVQAAVLLAGAVSDLFPRRAEGERDLSRRAAADRSRSSDACRSLSHLAVLAAIWIAFGGAAALRAYRDSGVLRLSDRVHAEPARPALRHRSDRPGEVGHADARPLVLGFRVPQLQLPSRAPLFSRACRSTGCRRCSARSCRSTSGTACGGRPIPVCCTAGSSRTGRRTPTGRSRRPPPAARRAPHLSDPAIQRQ